jgi:GntR family transcriptional regulator/MocR family aminotransferase
VVPVRVDGDGIVVTSIPDDARLVYVTPSHQFPLGMPMSLDRRLELLAWSRRTGAAILEDDYDTELRFDGRPLEPLQSLDRHGRVLYVGTFSKVLLPSLRLGFLVAPPSLVPALRDAKILADSHSDPAPQRALADLIDDGALARHIRKITRVYRERRDRLLAALHRYFGSRLVALPSSAGLHLSALFADADLDAAAVARRARDANVAVQALDPYYVRDPKPGLALGYGMIAASKIDGALRKLAG